MADKEMIERLWEASRSGATLRGEWLEEFVRSPGASEAMRALFEEADAPTQAALAGMMQEFADAPRRNASKPRRGKEHWRVLADYLNAEGPATVDAKLASLPTEEEEPLQLEPFWFCRRVGESRAGVKGPLICCTFGDGAAPDEISFATFERHLKNSKRRKSSGG